MRTEQIQQVMEIARQLCVKHGIAQIDAEGNTGLTDQFCKLMHAIIKKAPHTNQYQVIMGLISKITSGIPKNDLWVMTDFAMTLTRVTLSEALNLPDEAKALHAQQQFMYRVTGHDVEECDLEVLKRHSVTGMKYSEATMEVSK